jgi:DNA (cytosine-5)-methyltransferase 1
MNYYNEFDPKNAAWLRELIKRGRIPAGEVDERSITDVTANDLRGFVQCHFFAGIGGWPLALSFAGWPADRPVWTGSCPCQPFSSAGKQKGVEDERHLWPDFFRLIRECRPDTVFGEQVASAIGHGWLDGISADLEGEGYACGHTILGAHSVGAPHIRQRLYWVADTQHSGHGGAGWDASEPGSDRQDNGLPERDGGGMAHPVQRGQRGGDESRLGSTGREMGEQQDGSGAANQPRHGCQDAGGVADTPERGQRADGSAPGRTGHVDQRGERGWLPVVHACECDEPRLEGHSGDGNGGHQPGWNDTGTARPVAAPSNPWSDAIWLPCRDGKARRVKPGLPLLSHGVPARVVRLRGYGNAIVPQVAQAFIEAFLASQP